MLASLNLPTPVDRDNNPQCHALIAQVSTKKAKIYKNFGDSKVG